MSMYVFFVSFLTIGKKTLCLNSEAIYIWSAVINLSKFDQQSCFYNIEI